MQIKATMRYYITSHLSEWLSIEFYKQGSPGGSDGKESTCNVGDLGSSPGLRRYPGEGNGYLPSVLSPEEFHGQRRMADYSPWECKESDMTE